MNWSCSSPFIMAIYVRCLFRLMKMNNSMSLPTGTSRADTERSSIKIISGARFRGQPSIQGTQTKRDRLTYIWYFAEHGCISHPISSVGETEVTTGSAATVCNEPENAQISLTHVLQLLLSYKTLGDSFGQSKDQITMRPPQSDQHFLEQIELTAHCKFELRNGFFILFH